MKEYEIEFKDWSRWLFGEVPPSFFIEALLRCLIIFLLLVMAMRLMGKRMASQLSRNEMAAIVSLAAAIGVPLLAPERGLIPAFIIVLIVVLVSRAIAAFAFKNEHFEQISQGHMDLLVQSGVLNFNNMKTARMSKERVMAQLRSKSVKHLGMVKRLYLEASGSFTLIREEKGKPGLNIIPEFDANFHSRLKRSTDVIVCKKCGTTESKDHGGICGNCGNNTWEQAVE